MRNMRTANENAFGFLVEQLTSISSLTVKIGVRYIQTNEEEKKWLQELKITSIFQPLPDIKCVEITFQDNLYLALINANTSDSDLDIEIIEEEYLNAGVLTVLISEKLINFDSKVELLGFYNEIMFQHEDPFYEGHDFNDLLKYLQPINFYSFPKNSVLNKQELKRVLCYIYSRNTNRLINKFNTNVLNTYSELALMGSNNLSFGLVLSSLLSTSFKHTFLELYRLVERIFPLGYLKEFHQLTKSELSFIEFSSNLENITSWRPKEDEALSKIFDSTENSTKSYFDSFFDSLDNSQVSHYKYFYKLRNSIVHFRTSHNNIELTENQWNKLIHATLFLVDEHYSKNHNILTVN